MEIVIAALPISSYVRKGATACPIWFAQMWEHASTGGRALTPPFRGWPIEHKTLAVGPGQPARPCRSPGINRWMSLGGEVGLRESWRETSSGLASGQLKEDFVIGELGTGGNG